MRFKFTGDQGEITLRGVVFPKGKPVAVEDDDLAAKVAALDYFTEVKRGRKAKVSDDQDGE